MSSPAQPPHRVPRPRDLLALMDPWPQSWAGVPADLLVGAGLVAELRPFMMQLQGLDLSRKTLRRHLDNLWVIGGEIIRQVNDEPRLRRKKPRQLLLDTVATGEAPFVADASEADQRSVDATARRLLRFLTAT